MIRKCICIILFSFLIINKIHSQIRVRGQVKDAKEVLVMKKKKEEQTNKINIIVVFDRLCLQNLQSGTSLHR